jgi:uncharacterized RDD family membrane protein YckC
MMQTKFNINTSQNVNIELEIAGLGDRAIAFFIDSLILIAISIAFGLVVSIVSEFSESATIVFASIYGFFLLFFFFLCEWLMKGQTVGKRFRKIKVLHKTGRDASIWELLIRNLIRLVDSFYYIGLIFIIASKRAQRIGDFAAGTVVVKIDNKVSLQETAYVNLPADYRPHFPKLEILRLEEKDIELLKEVLNRPKAEMNWELIGMAAKSIQHKTSLNMGDLKSHEFLLLVIKDFQYFSLE